MISLAQSIPQTTKTLESKGFNRVQKPRPVPVIPTIPDPEKLTATLSDTEKKILNYVTYWLSTKGYCDSSIPQIASAVECGDSTVDRALAHFKELKLIYVTRRLNLSNFTYLNPYITENYTWYIAFAKICVWMPKLVLSLSMLMGNMGSASQTGLGALSYLKSIFTTTTPLLERVTKGGVDTEIKKKAGDMKQFDTEKGYQCSKIAKALLKRGAKLTQDEILNLLAYDKDILDRVSKAVRDTPNIRNLSAFFFGLLRKFTKEAGVVPDWEMVQKSRSGGLKLVKDEWIADPSLIVAEHKTPKTGAVDRPTYSDQVKQTMSEEKAAAAARAPKASSLDEKITECQVTISELEATTGLTRQYADIVLNKCRRELAELLAERDGVVEAEPVIAQAPALSQEEVKQWVQTMVAVDEFKATVKERAPSQASTPTYGQKTILEASSSSNREEYSEPVEEISDEEALCYSGQCDPFAPTENV